MVIGGIRQSAVFVRLLVDENEVVSVSGFRLVRDRDADHVPHAAQAAQVQRMELLDVTGQPDDRAGYPPADERLAARARTSSTTASRLAVGLRLHPPREPNGGP